LVGRYVGIVAVRNYRDGQVGIVAVRNYRDGQRRDVVDNGDRCYRDGQRRDVIGIGDCSGG
jgi:hypothetical protein